MLFLVLLVNVNKTRISIVHVVVFMSDKDCVILPPSSICEGNHCHAHCVAIDNMTLCIFVTHVVFVVFVCMWCSLFWFSSSSFSILLLLLININMCIVYVMHAQSACCVRRALVAASRRSTSQSGTRSILSETHVQRCD